MQVSRVLIFVMATSWAVAQVSKAQLSAPSNWWSETYFGSDGGYGTTGLNAGTFNLYSPSGAGQAEVVISEGSVVSPPQVSVQASANGGEDVGSEGSLSFDFQIENLGRGTAATVPIIVIASGGASSNEPNGASASLTLSNGQPSDTITVGSAVADSSSPDTFNANEQLSVEAGQPYSLDLNASISEIISHPGNPTTYASAFVDPLVVIAPGFAQASDYSVAYSPGIEVPEPSTMVIVLSSGAGLLARRRLT